MRDDSCPHITNYRGWKIQVDEVKHGFMATAKKDTLSMGSGEIFVFAIYAIEDAKYMIDKFESYC